MKGRFIVLNRHVDRKERLPQDIKGRCNVSQNCTPYSDEKKTQVYQFQFNSNSPVPVQFNQSKSVRQTRSATCHSGSIRSRFRQYRQLFHIVCLCPVQIHSSTEAVHNANRHALHHSTLVNYPPHPSRALNSQTRNAARANFSPFVMHCTRG